MLENLHIRNVALIDEVEIVFGKGLNILSGETGAGKSIIVDSINFLLGAKIGREFIRSGENEAYVEATFCIENEGTSKALAAAGVDVSEDRVLLLSRSINLIGKSVCRANGRTVTIGMLRDFTALFVDLHGQHEHQSLLDPARHIQLVDRFGGADIENLKQELSEKFREYKDIVRDISAISGDDKDRLGMIDLLLFQIEEIDKAKLSADEEETLDTRRKTVHTAEKLKLSVIKALTMLSGYDAEEMSALDKIRKAIVQMTYIASVDETKAAALTSLETFAADLENISADLNAYCETINTSPNEIDEIEKRADLIYALKRKYGASVPEIIEHHKELIDRYNKLVNSEEVIKRLSEEKSALEKEILRLCRAVSALRKEAASVIERDIIAVLHDLGMNHAVFQVLCERKDTFGANGYDKVEFFISPNEGEPPRPLAKTASGGEMSRVMLAIKNVLADSDGIETFIFDEIDTGVSGRTAQKVAEKLAALSKNNQILCITHLPQIAAMADNHYLIQKSVEDKKSFTNVFLLNEGEAVYEIARLTGGAKITEMTLKAAGEIREMAKTLKGL